VDKGRARPVGASLWRKQVLPVGEITYGGRRIAFTRDYLAKLVKAFGEKAYDVVPFQFADADNKHSNAPEQRRGTIRGLELTDDGLDALVEVSPEAQEYLSKYPDLGVSASIREGYERADGKFFPAAMRHVLGTLDPRLTGLRPWTAVEASNRAPAGGLWQSADLSADDDAGDVLDLTGIDYPTEDQPEAAPAVPADAPAAQKEAGMAFTTEEEARLKLLLGLPEDQFKALLEPAAEPDDDEGGEPEGAEGDGEELLSDAELEALLADIPGEDEPAGEPEPVLAGAGAELSAEAQAAIDLANSRAEEQGSELRRMREQLDLATYEKERDTYVRQGIPARLVDMAQPLLHGTGRTVELSNGKTADAGAITRKLLAEFGKTMQALGLEVELGNSEGADDEAASAERETAERKTVVAAARSQFGI
jgi:hypothetical protein